MGTATTRQRALRRSGGVRGVPALERRHPRARLEPDRIVVGLLCPIGDALFATPALAALRRRFPRAQITALAYPRNVGILEGNPDVDERVLVGPSDGGASLLRLA